MIDRSSDEGHGLLKSQVRTMKEVLVELVGTGRALFRVAGKPIGRGGFGEVYEAAAVGGIVCRRALKRRQSRDH